MAKPKKQRTASRQTIPKKSVAKSNPELDQWMTCDLKTLTDSQLIEGAVFLNKVADTNTKLELDELAVQQRGRAIDFLDAWIKAAKDQPEWVRQLHEYQLIQSGLACGRIADAATEKGEAKAAEYWEKGAFLFGQLLAQHPNQPEWVVIFHTNFLRAGGLAYDRVADAAKEKDEARAAECWQKGAALLGQLVANYLGNPEWVRGTHQKQLREGALACGRVADAAKEKDDARAAEYRAKGASMFGELLNHYPAQPEWVGGLHEFQLCQGGLACDRIARLAEEKGEARAAEYWEKGAFLFGQLLAQYPNQPEWVATFHANFLRAGGLAYGRVADAVKEKDDARAAEYWTKGATLFEQLLTNYPDQPEWVGISHANHLRKAEPTLNS